MALRVEFDPSNKILLLRFDGTLTDESIDDFYRVIRQHWTQPTPVWVSWTFQPWLTLPYPATFCVN
jgi:hypothetical protein